MNPKALLAGAVAVLALVLLGAACGGGDDGQQTSAIRTQKGLAVAAVSGQLGTDQTAQRQSAAAPAATGGSETSGTAQRSASTGADLGFKGVDYAPVLQAGGTGITVQGYGSATTDPDSAIIEFYFSRNGGVEPKPIPAPDSRSGSSSGSAGAGVAPETTVAGQAQPITEADLQPVIDALVGAGVARDKITFIGQSYYDPYYATSTLRAEIGDVKKADSVVQAAQGAAANLGDIYLTSTNVSYTVSDCAAIEKAAMEAAVSDAHERGTSFASALGVGLGDIVGATHNSYAPYGGTACDGNFTGPYPMGGIAYAAGSPGTVQVFASVSITYGIK